MSRKPRALRFLRLAALAAVVAACLIGWATYRQATAGVEDGPGPIAVFVGLAAILGSAVNQPFRDDAGGSGGGSGAGGGDQSHPALYFLWKCAVAVAFAFLLYLVFMGGLLSGGLFPEFQRGDHSFRSISRFVLEMNPNSNADFAKLLVWSFVAGFSGKFVPNLIAKLEGQASGQRNEAPADPADPSDPAEPADAG
jgi:hypothetical protein